MLELAIIVGIAQIITAVAAGIAVLLTWRAMKQERARHKAGVARSELARRKAELTDVYQRVLRLSGEMIAIVVLGRQAGYVNRHEAARLLSKMMYVAALIRMRKVDRAVVAEFERLAELVEARLPNTRSLVLAKLGLTRASDAELEPLQDQLLEAADAVRGALAAVQASR